MEAVIIMVNNVESLHLFEGFGIELEYMLVSTGDLSVNPLVDKLIHKVCGSYGDEVPRGTISWSNELALHVIEYKTSGPAKTMENLGHAFCSEIAFTNDMLSGFNTMLMPTAMHPFMDPAKELTLWPHSYNAVYQAFDKIFFCKSHGWANVQSMHINLPFCGDEEFGRLHAAIRLVLPIIPALAASSPVMDGKVTGFLDSRMEVYRNNSSKIPSITGFVIPEPVYSHQHYIDKILTPVYSDLKPYDPDGILQKEWVNARGAIARFDRNTIELRIIDTQENPTADLAVASLIIDLIRAFAEEKFCSGDTQKRARTEMLSEVFLGCIKEGENFCISTPGYLKLFGINESSLTAGALWSHVFGVLSKDNDQMLHHYFDSLNWMLRNGTLSFRIINALGPNPSRHRIEETYRDLCWCLQSGSFFKGYHAGNIGQF